MRYTTTRENGELRLIMSSAKYTYRYTTTRENGELRLQKDIYHKEDGYTTTRENGELRLKNLEAILPPIISAFSACVNPPSGEKRF